MGRSLNTVIFSVVLLIEHFAANRASTSDTGKGVEKLDVEVIPFRDFGTDGFNRTDLQQNTTKPSTNGQVLYEGFAEITVQLDIGGMEFQADNLTFAREHSGESKEVTAEMYADAAVIYNQLEDRIGINASSYGQSQEVNLSAEDDSHASVNYDLAEANHRDFNLAVNTYLNITAILLEKLDARRPAPTDFVAFKTTPIQPTCSFTIWFHA